MSYNVKKHGEVISTDIRSSKDCLEKVLLKMCE